MLKPAAAICALGMILLFPQAAVDGGQRAMRLWCTSVAPSIFPFLALMPILTGPEACSAYERLFSRVAGRLFGLPGAAAPAIAIGMAAGSPGGAIAASRIAGEAKMNRQDAHRLALAMCGLSPAYLILGVGMGLFGSTAIGWKLAGIQAAVQLTLLAVLRMVHLQGKRSEAQMQPSEWRGMRSAVETALAICGYMVLFSALASAAACIVGERMGVVLLAATDLPGGLAELAALESPPRMFFVCLAIGFGGICIAAQNVDALKNLGVSMKEYLGVRAAAAVLFALFGALILPDAQIRSRFELNAAWKYAFSLAAASFFAVPGLIFLSKNLFLNKSKPGKNRKMAR